MSRARLAFVSLIVAGCASYPDPIPCGQIPDGGCPIGRGGTCKDLVCEALFDCTDGAWSLVKACPGGGAGGGGGGGAGGGGASCEPVVIDKTGEVKGCKPDLQSPDCPAVAAETCPQAACLTDCSDFFLCTKDGWKDVAYCDPDGNLVIVGSSTKMRSK